MSNIYDLPAKRDGGRRRNVEWSIEYDRETREWRWHVIVVPAPIPSHFTGSAENERTARARVDAFLRTCVR